MKISRSTLSIAFFCAAGIAIAASTQSTNGAAYAGTWSGTWDGAGSGQFELTLDNAKDGAPIGRVAVTTDGGNYTADLRSIAYEGNKLNAAYDFPLDTSSEVAVSGSFEKESAKGTWSLHPKGQDAEVAGGTWTVTRK